jgi:hypothetical protein
MERDNKGRWLSGQSGNPFGRPPGASSRLTRQLFDAAGQILPKWIEAAMAGDEEKQRFILERGLPRTKAVSPPFTLEMQGNNHLDKLLSIFKAVVDGDLPASAGAEAANIVMMAVKVEEIETLKAELSLLKKILENRKN